MSIAEMKLGNNRAVVAPRVRSGEHSEPMRLVDWVEMMLKRGMRGWFVLHGGPGSGKTTALRELAERFADCQELKLVDEGRGAQGCLPPQALVIFASEQPAPKSGMQLAGWSRDEWIEYMLCRWQSRCKSVMGRVLKIGRAAG